MRVLVTGASGFLGVPVIQRLVEAGEDILALSRNVPVEITPGSIRWVRADLSEPSTYRQAVEEFAPEVLVHLAWQDIPDFSFEKSRQNLEQSLDLLTVVLGTGSCRKMLVAGSCLEVNRTKGECFESDVGSAKDGFTWAKHTIRSWLEVRCAEHGISLGWLRIFYVYGPRQRPQALVPIILSHLREGALPPLRTPANCNDFVYIGDLAEAFLAFVRHEFSAGVFNVSSGLSTSVLDVCRHAEQIVCGSDSLSRQLADSVHGSSADVDFWGNTCRIESEVGWSPAIPMADGILQTWQYLEASLTVE